jgi:hypothetical protein
MGDRLQLIFAGEAGGCVYRARTDYQGAMT